MLIIIYLECFTFLYTHGFFFLILYSLIQIVFQPLSHGGARTLEKNLQLNGRKEYNLLLEE